MEEIFKVQKDPNLQEPDQDQKEPSVLNLYSQIFIIESDLKRLKIVYEPI